MTPIEKLQLKNAIERVFHAPGNAIKDRLEWAFVFDGNMQKEMLSAISKDIIITLKQQSTLFQNARLNVVEWKSDTKIVHRNVSMPSIQLGSYFQEYEEEISEKRIENLAAALKMYQARSKLIILITDREYSPTDEKKWKDSMNPFLFGRIILWKDNKCSFFSRI